MFDRSPCWIYLATSCFVSLCEFVFTCACRHCEIKVCVFMQMGFFCFFSSILSCVSLLAVSKGIGLLLLLNVPLLYFVVFFLPIMQQLCGVKSLDAVTEHLYWWKKNSLNSKSSFDFIPELLTALLEVCLLFYRCFVLLFTCIQVITLILSAKMI